jgi:hypothetical protein
MLMDKVLDIVFPRVARSAVNKLIQMKELVGWGTSAPFYGPCV